MKAYSLEAALQMPDTVTVLYAQGRGWRVLPPGLERLQQLRVLGFGGNQFTAVPEVIAELTQLEELDLSGNKLEELPDFLAHLVRLKRLNLSNNRLSRFPSVLLRLPSLEQLNLSGNQIAGLPSPFRQWRHLQQLDLAQNKLKHLPPDFGALAQLQRLDVEGNGLQQLPESFAQLEGLSYLNLSNNKFVRFPEAVLSAKALRELRFSSNRLQQLPTSFGRLSELERLDFSKNKLGTLPDSLGQLRQLRRLDLSRNALHRLPATLSNCSLLARLNLAHNQLLQCPSVIGHLKQLERLDLSHNKLESCRTDLQGLVYLKELSLQDNQLKQVPVNLAPLTGLKRLDLRKNPISAEDRGWLQLPPVRLPGSALNQSLKPFLTACDKAAVPVQWRPPLYDIYCKRPVSGPFDAAFLEKALNFPLPLVREWAQEYVQQQHFKAFSGQFQAGDRLLILGNIALPIRRVPSVFDSAGVQVLKRWSPEATHVLIGSLPGPVQEVLKVQKLIGVGRAELRHWIQQQAAGFLWQNPSAQALKKIEGLLLSGQSTNIELAIQLLQANGIPQSSLNPLYVAYRKTDSAAHKRALRALLQLGVRSGDEALLQKKILPNHPEQLRHLLQDLAAHSSFDADYLFTHLTDS